MTKQANQNAKNTLKDRMGLMTIIKGITVSYIITIPTFIVFAVILTYTKFPEKFISSVVLLTTIISVLAAGSMATRNLKNKGWLNGGTIGLIYMLILYLLSSSVFRDFSINRSMLTMMIIGMLTGAIGGIVGINLKRNTRPKYKQSS